MLLENHLFEALLNPLLTDHKTACVMVYYGLPRDFTKVTIEVYLLIIWALIYFPCAKSVVENGKVFSRADDNQKKDASISSVTKIISFRLSKIQFIDC